MNIYYLLIILIIATFFGGYKIEQFATKKQSKKKTINKSHSTQVSKNLKTLNSKPNIPEQSNIPVEKSTIAHNTLSVSLNNIQKQQQAILDRLYTLDSKFSPATFQNILHPDSIITQNKKHLKKSTQILQPNITPNKIPDQKSQSSIQILQPNNYNETTIKSLSPIQSSIKNIVFHYHISTPGQLAIDNSTYNSISSILLPNASFNVTSGKLQNNDNIPITTIYTVHEYQPVQGIPGWYKLSYTPPDHFHEDADLNVSLN
jgi:hypothetical protein